MSRAAAACISPNSTARKLVSSLLNTKLSSLSSRSSSNRIHTPPNSLSSRLHFRSPQGCNMQRRPITTSAHKLCLPADVDDFLRNIEAVHAAKDGPLTCPLGWPEGHENEDISQIFEDWCKEYGKTYESDEEKLYRFRVFKLNYEYMRQLNEFGGRSYRRALDRFFDSCPEDAPKDGRKGGQVYKTIELPVVICCTVEAWNEQLAKGQRNNKLIVVRFGAGWCRPSLVAEDTFYLGSARTFISVTDRDNSEGDKRLVKEMPQVTFLMVDVTASEVKREAEKLGVDAIPTVLLMKNGQVVDKVVGPLRDELHRKIAMHAC